MRIAEWMDFGENSSDVLYGRPPQDLHRCRDSGPVQREAAGMGEMGGEWGAASDAHSQLQEPPAPEVCPIKCCIHHHGHG